MNILLLFLLLKESVISTITIILLFLLCNYCTQLQLFNNHWIPEHFLCIVRKNKQITLHCLFQLYQNHEKIENAKFKANYMYIYIY